MVKLDQFVHDCHRFENWTLLKITPIQTVILNIESFEIVNIRYWRLGVLQRVVHVERGGGYRDGRLQTSPSALRAVQSIDRYPWHAVSSQNYKECVVGMPQKWDSWDSKGGSAITALL